MALTSSALAVRYSLQLDDALTPALEVAERNYTKFTKAIEKLNKGIEKSISKTFDRMGAMAGAFGLASSGGASSVGKSKKSMQAGSMDRAIEAAVTKALGKFRLRMSAALPKTKSGKFNVKDSTPNYYKHLPQPADMVGMFEAMGAKKFAKGGLVTGTQGKDKVPSLLTAGEFVLTKDQTAEMLKGAGALKSATGKFASGLSLGKVVTEMKVLTIQAEKLKVAAEGGMNPKAAEAYERALQRLTIADLKLTRETEKLSEANKIMLAPALMDVRGAMKKVEKEMEPIQEKTTKTIFGFIKMDGIKFVALHLALKNLQENFLETKSALDSVNGALNLEKAADGLVKNFQQMNKTLGFSSKELGDLRDVFVDNAAVLPISVRDLGDISEAMQGLVESGVSGAIAAKLAPAIEMLAESTGIARDSAVQLGIILSKDLKMGATESADAMAKLALSAKAVGVPAQAVASAMHDAFKGNEAYFKSLDPAKAAKVIGSLVEIAAAGESISAGFGAELSKKLADAATGLDPAALSAVAGVMHLTTQAARQLLESGDTTKLFASLEKMDPTAVAAFGDALQLSSDGAANLANNSAKFTAALQKTHAVSIAAGSGLTAMAEAAADNKTTFQMIRDTLGNMISNTFPNTLAFFSDLNVTALASGAYLAMTFIPMLWNMVAALIPTQLGMWGMVAASWAFTASLLANPLTWIVLGIVAAVALLVGGFMLLWKHCQPFQDALKFIGTLIVDYILFSWNLLMSAFSIAWKLLAPIRFIFALIGKIISTVIVAEWNMFVAAISWVWDKLKPIRDIFAYIGGLIKDGIVAEWDMLVAGISWVWDKLKGFADWMDGVFNNLWEGGTSGMLDMLNGFITNITDFFTSLPSKVWESIKGFAVWLGKALYDLLPSWVIQALKWAKIITTSPEDKVTPMQTGMPAVSSAPGAGDSANRDIADALERSNQLLEKVAGNTEDMPSPRVVVNVPKSPSILTAQLAGGMI